jgi:triosephosphate isomerase
MWRVLENMDKLVVGNWKMNGSIGLVESFLEKLSDKTDVILAVPYPLLFLASQSGRLAAQDCSIFREMGAHTGEVPASMLKDLGCSHVIIGHSERRVFFNETKEVTYGKFMNAVDAGLIPIFCIDSIEQLPDDKDFRNSEAVIAYEPVSAVGTGAVPSVDHIKMILHFIKDKFTGKKVIYGGSVDERNAGEILDIEEADGVLVGGASLSLEKFLKIVDLRG